MCGIVAISSAEPMDLGPLVRQALVDLAHRGEDGWGLSVRRDHQWMDIHSLETAFELSPFVSEKTGRGIGRGFPDSLFGTIALGHVRYATQGGVGKDLLQPMPGDEKTRFCFNGHLELDGQTDGQWLQSYMRSKGMLEGLVGDEQLQGLVSNVDGALSLLASDGEALYGFRDKSGARPLVAGVYKDPSMVVLASETPVITKLITSLGLEPSALNYLTIPRGSWFKVQNGKFEGDYGLGLMHSDAYDSNPQLQAMPCGEGMCALEWIYFASESGQYNGKSLRAWREASGQVLARLSPASADLVIPIPASGLPAGQGFARASNLPIQRAIEKKVHGRSFIQSNQADREGAVRSKFHFHRETIKNKRVVLVDDSLVRGTTLHHICQQVKGLGAKEVHVRIASPQVVEACTKGIALPTREELVCSWRSVDEVQAFLGVDSLAFLPEAFLKDRAEVACRSCFVRKSETQG